MSIGDKYEIGNDLGEGQFGKVKAAVDLVTGHRFAVKIIRKANIKTKKDVDTVKKEVAFMKELNGHENILNMIEVLDDNEKLYIILELATGGDLFDKIIQVGGFSEEEAREFFKQIVSGLIHCHSKGIIHRDMKPENLLLGADSKLKISDFGLSNVIQTPQQMLKTHCGSEKYAAPEVMQSTDPYLGPPVDVWSIGVILYIMIGGAFPFVEATENCELFKSLVDGTFQFPQHFSPELIDLLKKTFTIDPTTRITAEQIQQHPWVNPHAAAKFNTDSAYDTIMMDEEEPQFRTLDADIMSIDQGGMDEEPIYRSIELDDAEPSGIITNTTSNSCTGFACKPAHQFTTVKAPTEVMEFLACRLRDAGATVKVKPEKGQVKAECTGPSGDRVKVKIFVKANSVGTTEVSIKRMLGHALDFCDLHAAVRPCLDEMCKPVSM